MYITETVPETVHINTHISYIRESVATGNPSRRSRDVATALACSWWQNAASVELNGSECGGFNLHQLIQVILSFCKDTLHDYTRFWWLRILPKKTSKCSVPMSSATQSAKNKARASPEDPYKTWSPEAFRIFYIFGTPVLHLQGYILSHAPFSRKLLRRVFPKKEILPKSYTIYIIPL